VIGVGGGFKAEVNLLALMGKRGTLRASTLRPRPLEEKADTARAVERELLPALVAGTIHVPIAQTFALADAESAYAAFSTSGKFGKVVLLND
jgi:NADPH:quinone reductase-like Zn-dependent oxidoreductase